MRETAIPQACSVPTAAPNAASLHVSARAIPIRVHVAKSNARSNVTTSRKPDLAAMAVAVCPSPGTSHVLLSMLFVPSRNHFPFTEQFILET